MAFLGIGEWFVGSPGFVRVWAVFRVIIEGTFPLRVPPRGVLAGSGFDGGSAPIHPLLLGRRVGKPAFEWVPLGGYASSSQRVLFSATTRDSAGGGNFP
jgi:hypothetical protein